MLTRLRLKNWRSVKDATIDLSPITVFIGANSSGKTNILDAIRFKRDSLTKGLVQVVLEYALDIPQEYTRGIERDILAPSLPGLVVIEEPDTALNPWLFSKFVDQIRTYVKADEDRPRQFILTTHNPTLLNVFEPDVAPAG